MLDGFGHVPREEREELAHLVQPGPGGGVGAEDLDALPGGIGSHRVGLCDSRPCPIPDVVVDEVSLASLPSVAFASDQLRVFKVSDGLGD